MKDDIREFWMMMLAGVGVVIAGLFGMLGIMTMIVIFYGGIAAGIIWIVHTVWEALG